MSSFPQRTIPPGKGLGSWQIPGGLAHGTFWRKEALEGNGDEPGTPAAPTQDGPMAVACQQNVTDAPKYFL